MNDVLFCTDLCRIPWKERRVEVNKRVMDLSEYLRQGKTGVKGEKEHSRKERVLKHLSGTRLAKSIGLFHPMEIALHMLPPNNQASPSYPKSNSETPKDVRTKQYLPSTEKRRGEKTGPSG